MMTINPSRLNTMVIALCLTSGSLSAQAENHREHVLQDGQEPTKLQIVNETANPVYLNIVFGQMPSKTPPNCSAMGSQITTIQSGDLVFTSSLKREVKFHGPKDVFSKGAFLMKPHETITYMPNQFACFNGKQCSPAIHANLFFTEGFNGTTKGNNGCGGKGTAYPNATNLAEFSINFGINAASGLDCPNADDTDISAVSGVNAIIRIDTQDKGTGAAWPEATQIIENKRLGENVNNPGVFGWSATNCTNPQGYQNPKKGCPAPVDAPKAHNGTCALPTTLIADGYCAQTSAAPTCNNQREGFTSGGTVVITYKGHVPPKAK